MCVGEHIVTSVAQGGCNGSGEMVDFSVGVISLNIVLTCAVGC